MIAKLRWINRGGEFVLQEADSDEARIVAGEIVWTWRDVPLESEG